VSKMRSAPAMLLLALSAPLVLASPTPATRILSVVNTYPSEFDLGASFSVVHETDLRKGSEQTLKLTLRLGSHLTTPFVRLATEPTILRAFTDGGNFLTLDASRSLVHWEPLHSHKVGKEAASAAAAWTLFADNAVVPTVAESAAKSERVWAMDAYHNIRAISARNGTVLAGGRPIGRVDAGPPDPYGKSYATLLPRAPDEAEETLFLAHNAVSHRAPSRLLAFDPLRNTTRVVWSESDPATDGLSTYFCGLVARPSTRRLYALMERHNRTNFPDDDCQNLSGLVQGFAVLEMPNGAAGPAAPRTVWRSPDTYLGLRSGGPMDDAAGLWHLINAGKVISVNVTADATRGAVSATSGLVGGEIDGEWPVLLPAKAD
jgi:hypothetical protein